MSDGKNLFMAGIGGNPRAGKKLSLQTAADNLLPAMVSCGINAAGGAMARAVGNKIDSWKPGYGTIGVAIVSVGLKTLVQPVDDVHIAVRELAAGMAGYVGDEVFDGVVMWWKSELWKPGKVWKKAQLVRFDPDGKYYQAKEDVPASAGSPAKDDIWMPVSSVTYQASDLKECARLVLQDRNRVEMIAGFVAMELGRARGWKEQEIAGAATDIVTGLGKVGEEIAKL